MCARRFTLIGSESAGGLGESVVRKRGDVIEELFAPGRSNECRRRDEKPGLDLESESNGEVVRLRAHFGEIVQL